MVAFRSRHDACADKERALMRRTLAFSLAGWLAAGAMCGSASPALASSVTYAVEDLGTLPGDYASVAMGINQLGDVVGWSAGPTGTRAFVYTAAGGMTALPAPAGRPVTTARAINGSGVVVGTASTGGTDVGQAVRWQSGVATNLGSLGSGLFSEARGLNATGTIVGSSSTDGGGLLGTHAFRYTDASGMVDLTPGYDSGHAEGINDAGQIVGWRNGRAFRMTGETFTDLGVPTGFAQSFASAVNGTGQVAGHVVNGTGSSERIFRYANGVMTLVGGLGEYNRAYGINAAGDIVGQGLPVLGLKQGFLYTDANGMQGLNQLIEPGSGWFILGASGINDAGQIVGWASGPNGQRAVRLTPSVVALTPPAAPTGLAGQALSGDRVRLTWTDNAGNESGFRVQRALGSQGSFVVVGQVAANVATFTDTTANGGKAYRYRVQAYNAAGSSSWSNTIRIRTRR
jgi:probable HAF family extracellular repeat protein